MILFSAIAVYLTSVWNQGFVVDYRPIAFAKATLIIALIYYLILPIIKILILPLNIISLGLASLVAYLLTFYFFISRYGIIKILGWKFGGLAIFGVVINPMTIGYGENVILSALSVSIIINLISTLL